MKINGTFAIYPAVDAQDAQYAVIWCDDADLAKQLCERLDARHGIKHHAYLRMPSWEDPRIIWNLNGCENFGFSIRDPHAAERASYAVREMMGPLA